MLRRTLALALSLTMVVLGTATGTAAAEEIVRQAAAAASDPGPLPRQEAGGAEGRGHDATTSATSAGAEGGRQGAAPVPGELPEDRTAAVDPAAPVLPPPAAPPVGEAKTVGAPAKPLGRTERQPAGAQVPKGFDPAKSTELPAKRTANQRTFQNLDGTLTTRSYPTPVNFRRSDGSWVAIDTTLIPDGKAGAGRAAPVQNSWTTASGESRLSLGLTADADPLVSLELGAGASVGYSLQDAAAVQGTTQGSTITYADARPRADLTFQAGSTSLKEMLVLKDPTAPTEWLFPLRLHGVSAALDANGAVVFTDPAGTPRGRIPAGWMQDSAFAPNTEEGQVSGGVSYELVPTTGGGQALKVTLDAAWLHAPERVYPVKVDPSLSSVKAVDGTYIESPYNLDFSADTVLKVGTYDGGAHQAESYIRFNGVENALGNANVLGVRLSLFNGWSSSCRARTVSIHQITSNWWEGSLRTFPGPSTGPALAAPAFAHGWRPNANSDWVCGQAWESIDLGAEGRNLVNSWTHGWAPNYGLAIKSDIWDSFAWKQFGSDDHNGGQPVLDVTWSKYGADYELWGLLQPMTATQEGVVRLRAWNRGQDTWSPGNNYKMSYLLFDAWGNNITDYGSNVAWTSMPHDVPPGGGVVIDAHIRSLPQGTYTVAFTMDEYEQSNFWADAGVQPIAIQISSVNMDPHITRLAPPSGAVVYQLQPTLTAEGLDPDRAPFPELDFRFEVCRVVGGDTRVDCKQSSWLKGQTRFVVPEGWLSWNEQYAWYAQAGDGFGGSQWTLASYIRTVLPQPTGYVTGADAGRNISTSVGNYTTAATDASLPAVGPELAVTRSYNSLDPRTDGAFGAGWSTAWDMRINVESGSWLTTPENVVLTAANGSRTRFGWDPGKNAYVAGGSTAADLRKAEGGGWTLTERSGKVHTFDQSGRLITITDVAGHTQEISYIAPRRVGKVKDTASGRSLTFTWNAFHLIKVTPSDSSDSWSYEYSGNQLSKVCPPGVDPSGNQGGCTTYTYSLGSLYRTSVRDAGPVGYWRLGERSGTEAVNDAPVSDRSPGAAQDVSWGAQGAITGSFDQAVTFNGRPTSFVELPTASISGSSNRTVELWFRTNEPGVLLTYQNRGMGEDPYNVVPALYVGSDHKLRGKFNSAGDPITSRDPVTGDRWHHVVLSGARDNTALFLDGVKVGTTAGDIDHLNMDRTFLGGGYTGNWPGGNGGWSWLNGQIDEVAVYDRPLTDATVAEHYALRLGGGKLNKTVLPTGRTSDQVSYNPLTERVTKVTDAAGGEWKLSEPAYTGGSFLYSNAVKASDPAGFWRLGERDGALAKSEVGTGLSGTYGDGVTKRQPGVFAPTDDTAARFDGGSSAQVEIPEDVLHGGTDVAVELWFNTTAPGVLLGDQSRALDDPGGVGGTWTPVMYVGSDGKLYGRFCCQAAQGTVSANAVTDGTWHHAVLSAQGNSQTLYLDGQVVGTQQGAVDHQANTHTYLGAGSARYWPASPGDVSRFSGLIDEAAVYRHPLTEADVVAHYRARSAQVTGQGVGYRGAVVTDSPAGYWRLDETGGTVAASEIAATSGKGTYAASAKPGTTGVFGPGDGRAVEFNGTDSSYVELPTPILQTGNELAAEMWFSTTAPGVLLSLQDQPMNAGPNSYNPALYVDTDGRLRGKFFDDQYDILGSPGAVTDGSWHHAVLSAGQGTQSLYLDGVLVSTIAGTVDHHGMNRTYLGGGQTGGWPGGNGGWSWFNGQIDEVTFYRHPLGADRVAAHYQTRSQSSATELASRVTLTDPVGNVSTEIHDATRANRLVARTDESGATTTYGYDTGGFVRTVTDPNGHTAVSGHDARGNTVSYTTCRDVNSCWTSYTSYFLNPDNPRDPRNDKPTETRDARSSGPTDNTYRTTVSYTAYGLPETTTRPDGRTTSATYTTGAEPATGGGTTPPGLLATETTAGGAVTTYAYNAAGDLTATTNPAGLTLTYGYNTAGRKTWATETSDSQPAGVTTTYAYDPVGRMVTQTGPKVTDAVTGAEHQTRTILGFDADGRITSSTTADVAGSDGSRTTSSAYDAAGRLESDTDALGQITRYGYDVLGRQSSVTDALSQVTRFTYTARGQRATTVVEGWNGDGIAPRDLTLESRAYDPGGRLASVTDAVGAVTRYTYFDDGLPATSTAENVTQADGTTRSIVLEANEYDGAGYLVKQTTGGGRTTAVRTVDSSGRVVRSTLDPDGLGRTTDTGYDADDRVVSTTTRVSGAEDSVQTHTYDLAGRLTRSQTASSTGGPTAATMFSYDQRGLLTSTTTPNGNAPGADAAAHTSTFQYDALGRTTAVVGPQAQVENTGGSVTVQRPSVGTGYNTFGEVVASKDALGNVVRTTVDPLGRTTEVRLPAYTPPGATTALNPVARTEYDKLSRVSVSTDPAGRRTTFAYDRLGHQTKRVEPNSLGGLQPQVDDNPPTWTATWTPTGLQLSATDPVGARTQATYDQLGRTLTATLVERQPTTQNLTTRFTWDDAGNQIAVTSPGGHTSRATHNSAGQVVTTVDPLGRTTKTEYDGLGRATRVTAPLGESVRTRYDSLGNAAVVENLDPAGAVLRTVTAGYDHEGRALTSTSPTTGAVTSTEYDVLGRAVKLTEPVSAGQSIVTTFGYDAVGNRTRLTDGRGNRTLYTFNTWGLPESTVEPSTSAHPAAADRTWGTVYDVAGQPVKTTEPGAVVRTRTFDPAGRLVREVGTGAESTTTDRELTYDKSGHLIRHSANGLAGQSYAYNDRGLLIKSGPDLNAPVQTWQYDSDGRMTKRWDKGTGDTLIGYLADGSLDWAHNPQTRTQNRYTYDGDGRLATQAYVAPDPADTTRVKTMSERRLSYDPLGRLSADQLAAGGSQLTSTAYTYDLDNRLTRKTVSGATTGPVKDNTYGYDLAGRLTSWTVDGTTVPYTWDAAGNRTGNGSATATYDERNRLLTDGTSSYRYTARGTLAVVITGPKQENLAYDAFGRLITDGATAYTYDGLDRVTTRNAAKFTYDGGTNNLTGDSTWSYTRDSAGTLLGATNGTDNIRVRTDQHTDATATLNSDGTAVVGSTTYDPFGKPVTTSGTRSSLGYQSGWTDPTTGDVNMHARWYRPGTGGFTSRDSWQLNPTPSVQANRYTYANASPLNGTDPSGHIVRADCGCGGPMILGATAVGVSVWATGPGSSALNDFGNSLASGISNLFTSVKNTVTSWTNSTATAGAGTAASTLTGSTTYADDIALEKKAARDRVRPGGGDGPGPGPGPGGGSGTGGKGSGGKGGGGKGTGSGGRACVGLCAKPREPRPVEEQKKKEKAPEKLWDPTTTTIERPTPQPDWEPPKPGDILRFIAGIYEAADLLNQLTADQNAVPTTEDLPWPMFGFGIQNPLASEGRGQSCRGSDGKGWRDYGGSDPAHGNRATGIEACLDSDYLSTHKGSSPDAQPPGIEWSKDFARWLGLSSQKNINRCHLLADVLSGEGDVVENLSPCSRSANTFVDGPGATDNMRQFEARVKEAIDAGSIVRYKVVPKYAGDRTVPAAYEMMAYGTDGQGRPNFSLADLVPNFLYSPKIGSVNLGSWVDSRSGRPVPTGSMP
ncbi:LamG-like jellyroll fold domain-containing protein [Kitasatospora purpeofusca]|uniref:LamG-like jellyroll fold domain-containing protein n=1 Tax=Kitasatospora purpeofusca TaxID=67352 RepID=UPI0035E1BCB0